jgi:hypothetical protein
MGNLFIVSGIFIVVIQYYFLDLYMNGIFIKGSLASLLSPAHKNDLSSLACARDLTDLYTITIFDIKFKNAFRAHRRMCIKGRGVSPGSGCISWLFLVYKDINDW